MLAKEKKKNLVKILKTIIFLGELTMSANSCDEENILVVDYSQKGLFDNIMKVVAVAGAD